MLFWIYNIALILALPFLAVVLTLRALFYKKRSFFSYLFPDIPKKVPGLKTIWIHAVSLGEVNTAANFINTLALECPDYEIFVSSVTETGFKAASKLSKVKAFYLPLDIYLLQQRVTNKIQPSCFLAVEGDLWPALSHLLYKKGVKQAVISAKLSDRSSKRLKQYPLIADFLYRYIDRIYAQDLLMKERFQAIGIDDQKIIVAGNLKYGLPIFNKVSQDDQTKLSNFLKLDTNKKTLAISCTHEGEEVLILEVLKNVLSEVNIIIIPRHPQRFHLVYNQLLSLNYKIALFSKSKSQKGDLFLIDAIGVLSFIYQRSDLVILGGSFVENIGGHNLLEPVYCKCPVIVGPHMETQLGLLKLMYDNKLGIQSSLIDLPSSVYTILQDEKYLKQIDVFIKKGQNPAKDLLKIILDDFHLY